MTDLTNATSPPPALFNNRCDCSTVRPFGCNQTKDPPAGCPDWQQRATAGGDPDLQHAKGVAINRTTTSWNSAASCFAYAFGTLALRGYLYVGMDQLVGGTWPVRVCSPCLEWSPPAHVLSRASVHCWQSSACVPGQ